MIRGSSTRALTLAVLVCLPSVTSGRAIAMPHGRPPGRQGVPPQHWLSAAGMTNSQLELVRAQLASPDDATRRRAISTLAHLTEDSLPAIRERMRKRRGLVLDPERARAAMSEFGRAFTAQDDNDVTALVTELSSVLAHKPTPEALAIGEALLLLRAVESMQTVDAGRAMAAFVDLDDGLWKQEMRRVRARAGLWLLPALIELRSHARTPVKRWAVAGINSLGMTDPKRATGVPDHHLAALVIRAYGSPLDFDAMPTVVRLVAANRVQVREAARWTTQQFGKNAIWQLRELYEELTGQRANRKWGWQRTAQELYTVIDREAIERASTAFARGMQQFVAGDFEAMHQAYDDALAHYPGLPERHRMAAGYAALGARRYAHEDLSGAERAYQRAARLAASETERKTYLARLWLCRSEAALTTGVVDLHGYDKALALDPQLGAARRAREALDGTARRRERNRRRWAAGGSLALVLALMALLLRTRSASRAAKTPAPNAG